MQAVCPASLYGEMHLAEHFRDKPLVLKVAPAHHRQCGRLYPSDGVRAAPGGNGHCLRSVAPYQPVAFASRLCRIVQSVIFVAAFQPSQPLTDGLVCQRADPEAVEGCGAPDIFIQIAEDKLALPSCVHCHDNLAAFREQAGDYLYLCHHVAVRLVAFLRPFLTGDECENRGDEGQVFPMETLDAVAFRQGGLYQVPEGPCHGIAVSRKVAFLSFCRAHDAGNLTCHAGLLRQDTKLIIHTG